MKKSLMVGIDGIGPLLIERSKKAKYVSISIRAYRGVRVAVPLAVSFDKTLEFIRLKEPWIKKHLAIISRREAEGITLAETNGFTFNKLSIRNQKTQ